MSDYPANRALSFEQFELIDAVRRLQGDLLASIGFGPVESSYRFVASGHYWRLRDYGSSCQSRSVLVVAAPIKRAYIWDLIPAISAVRRCLDAGLRVYLLEWSPATEATCGIGIADCARAISDALATIGSGGSAQKPVLMGHSLGGTLAAIYAASAPETVGGLILLSAPLCFKQGDSLFRDALVSLVPTPVSHATPYPGSVLSQASAAASPVTFVWSRYLDAISCVTDGIAMDVHGRVERWALDEVALPGKLVSEIVEWLYRENRFYNAVLDLEGRTIGPQDLETPTLAVVNMADLVAPLNSVRPLGDILGPARFRIIRYGGERGVCLQHLGVLVGREAHAHVWPQIIDWIRSLESETGVRSEAS
jgi:poly[(R)-3-hydroxyalkanoate] polymerase subunit PhaC